MSNTKDEDRATAKLARSAIARSALDISELHISCNGGYIELDGKVRLPRGSSGHVSVRKEFQNLLTLIRGVRGVRDANGGRVVQIES